MQVKSDDKTVFDVLSGSFLRVPRFQRPYEWTDGEVEDFWEDFTEGASDYFIGSMVVFPSTHATAGLVDGQQRLTTITLLLCVIRDALRSAGKSSEANGLHNLIERASVLDNNQHFVLQTDEDNPYLRFVQAGQAGEPPAPTVAERTLRAAHAKLKGLVTSATGPEDQTAKKLIALRDKLLALRLIYVEVDNEDDATVIFQTLNSRGRDLETSDLVKSHLFSLLKSKNPSHDGPRAEWNSIRESFAQSSVDLPMDRFLLHSWLSRREYLAQANLGKTVRKRIKKRDAPAFLKELVLDARLYREIQETDFRTPWVQEELGIKAALEMLHTFRIRQPLPWLLALWRAYDEKSLKQKNVIPAVRLIENFHFLVTAVTNQPSSGGVSRQYSSYASRLTDSSTLAERTKTIDELAGKLKGSSRVPTEDQFLSEFAEIRSSKRFTQQLKLALYTLRRLHAFEAPSPPDTTLLTVEHLVPQGSNRPPEVSEKDVARLGNLILIPRPLNDKLGDKQFSEKLPILKQAAEDGVFIDPTVLSASAWGAEQIEERTVAMGKLAYTKVWKI